MDENDAPERLVISACSSLLHTLNLRFRALEIDQGGRGWISLEDLLYYLTTTNTFVVLDDPCVQERIEEVRKLKGG